MYENYMYSLNYNIFEMKNTITFEIQIRPASVVLFSFKKLKLLRVY